MADEIKNSVDVYYGEQLIGNVSHGETGDIDCKGREMLEDIRIKVPYDMKAVKYQDKRFTINKNGKHTLYSDEDYVMEAAIVEVEVPSDNIWLGEFDSDFPYRVGSIVSQNNMVYICIVKPTDNQPPTDTTYWELLSGKIQDEKIVDIITYGKLEFLPDEGYVAVRKFTANVAETPIFDGTINIESGFTTISGSYLIDASKAYDALAALPASKTYLVEFSAGSIMNGEQEKKGFISMTFNVDGDKSIIYGRADGSVTAFSSTEHMTGGDGFAPYYNTYEEGNGARVNFYEGTECRKEFKELFLSIADEYVEEETEDELSGTWVFNSGWSASEGYGNFAVNTTLLGESYSFNNIYVGYAHTVSSMGIPQFDYEANSIVLDGGATINKSSTEAFTITITSKLSEVTNGATLLAWLKANATKQGSAKLISFTIDGTSYQAEEGMTWEEWVESEYNTGDFVVYRGAIYEDSNLVSILQTADNYNVDPTYIIISNHAYWLNTTGGAN